MLTTFWMTPRLYEPHSIGNVVNIRFLLVLVGLVVSIGGCGRKSNLPPLAEVTGTVTLDGEPLPGMYLQFVPNRSAGTVGPPAVGQIGSDGRYELRTAGQMGALVGSHRVKIVGYYLPSNPDIPFAWIPKQYSDYKTSGVEAIVNADEVNEIKIELTLEPGDTP